MLIYSKKNSEGKLALYGTLEKVPNAETDLEVVYKDAEGNVVTLMDGDIYVDVSSEGIQKVKRLSDDKALTVYISSADGTLTKVIGEDVAEVSSEEVVEEETQNQEEVVEESSSEEVVEPTAAE